MARLCTGCETQYPGRDDGHIASEAVHRTHRIHLRRLRVAAIEFRPPAMGGFHHRSDASSVEAGFAVTSHDPAQLNTTVFGSTER
jgi:hypothetical protein